MLLDVSMRQERLARYRRKVIPTARGRVLETGIGSGLNLPLYGEGVDLLVGLDPSEGLLSMANRRAAGAGVRTALLQGTAMHIPLGDATVDTVVLTWTLCSIPDPEPALREIRRVLEPSGALLFAEHGLSPEPAIERWQHRLTPMWRHVAGGCHLDRKIDDLIRLAGFELSELRTDYASGFRPMTCMYEGCARPTVDRHGRI
jgi:ubiquinone/menaquinone biosynthesis C-methylase UbiE